jgi:glutamine synthetase
VHDHAGLLRAGIATSGNEHRLGANEAPPAIISVFMGEFLTKVIDAIAHGKVPEKASDAMLNLGVARLPEIAKDVTDRNRTSPFAFTGNKFEFRAVGSSQSIAFPIVLLNAAVAGAIGEVTDLIRAEMKNTKQVDDAVLKVVGKIFKQTAAVRFEGNNYSDEWVKEAKKRGLLNLRRSPEALQQLVTKSSRDLLTGLGIMTAEEVESRYHIRLERYIKDMLIELHTLREIVDTHVLPAGFTYASSLLEAASNAKAAGVPAGPQIAQAKKINQLITTLQKERDALEAVLEKAEGMHAAGDKQAKLLTGPGADAMAAVRAASDAIEFAVPDSCWSLPKYREMLFPV